MAVETVADFQVVVADVEKNSSYQKPLAFAIGVATLDSKGNQLDAYFPAPNFQANYGAAAIISKVLGHTHGTNSYVVSQLQLAEMLSYFTPFTNDGKRHANIEALQLMQKISAKNKQVVASFIAPAPVDAGPQSVSDSYLRLHLLSHRLVKPHGINLNGIFKVLPNVAWTSEGAISIDDLSRRNIEARISGNAITVHSVDKFPRMVDYVVPSGVRIADASRVRLGAYLGEGTTIMHEGFVNFNAGCEGPNMVEGRISSGVFVKKGSDLGGGCSTMGTLSGGGNIVISIGEDCLIGANAGLGIPLGNRCTIESGLYVTSGTKLLFEGKIIKASSLSGKDDILFRRNSQTGQVEAISRANNVELNSQLHSN